MRRILIVAFLVLSVHAIYAQQQNCAQTLRLARSTYDQGRLHELPSLMKECLKPDGFNKQERVEAYKLLTMGYIYLEEPEKADSSMLLLLKTDPYFLPNEKVDPQEFLGLYKTFRTDPVYRIGMKAGVAFSQPNVINSIAIKDGTSKYDYQAGVVVGAALEMPIFKKFVLNPELLFVNRRFNLVSSVNNNSTTSAEAQSWLALPISVQYEFFRERFKKNERKILPYVSLGIQTDYLLSASVETTTERIGSATITPQTYDIGDSRKKINLSAILSAGIKIKAGPGLLVGEVRYLQGLTPVTTTNDVLSNQPQLFNNYENTHIFSMNALAVTVGYGYNIFKPKKLNRKVRTSIKKK